MNSELLQWIATVILNKIWIFFFKLQSAAKRRDDHAAYVRKYFWKKKITNRSEARVFHHTVDRCRDRRDHRLDHAASVQEYFPKNKITNRSEARGWCLRDPPDLDHAAGVHEYFAKKKITNLSEAHGWSRSRCLWTFSKKNNLQTAASNSDGLWIVMAYEY